MGLFTRQREATMQAPATPAARLADLESTIQTHQDAFCRVGAALAAIRAEKLYRLTHTTWGAYVLDRWGMKLAHACRLIAAATVAENFSNMENKPANEAQARELARLTPEEQRQAFAHAQVIAGNTHPTARHVAEAAEQIRPRHKPRSRRRPRPIRLRVPGGIVILEPRRPDTDAAEMLRHAQTVLERKAAA